MFGQSWPRRVAQQLQRRAGRGRRRQRCIAVMPCLVGEATPALARVSEPHDAPGVDVWLVTHRELREVARVSALWEHLVRAFAADGTFRRR